MCFLYFVVDFFFFFASFVLLTFLTDFWDKNNIESYSNNMDAEVCN